MNTYGYSRALSFHYFRLHRGDAASAHAHGAFTGCHGYRNPGGSMTGNWDRVTFPIDVDGDALADVIAEDLPAVYETEPSSSIASNTSSWAKFSILPPKYIYFDCVRLSNGPTCRSVRLARFRAILASAMPQSGSHTA